MPSPELSPDVAARLKRDDAGLVAAIIQDDLSDEVLMLGWMDDEALRRTLSDGRVTFWSRSRQEYWRKGDTSGHAQFVRSIALDCDGDALLVRVEQVGAACHTGERSCFFTTLDATQAHAPMTLPAPDHATPVNTSPDRANPTPAAAERSTAENMTAEPATTDHAARNDA